MAEGQQQISLTATEKSRLKTDMVNRLAHTNAHFKHQQRGEPDLPIDEKREIANKLLEKSDSLFLERFSNYLTPDDIPYFSESDDYQIRFYIKEIQERANVHKSQNMVKNRRYQALQEMMDQGDYFSEKEMQSRDPLLFEQMIGQHETEDEKQAREVDKSDLRFSSILMRYMDIQETKENYDRLKEREEEQEEEEEESDEEEEEKPDAQPNASDEDESKISIQEQGQLRDEFLRIMQERFLSGEDREFDYSKVDSNSAYDSIALLNQDAEDRYFDEDDQGMDTGQ